MTTSIDLSGRRALVTGASRGIGRAIAILLAEAGADVAINFLSRTAEAGSAAAEVAKHGRRVSLVQADVSRASEVAAMFEKAAADLGPIDILVNNVGLAMLRTPDDITEDEFDRTIAVNLKSAFLCTQAALPAMRAQQWGRIVNISSGAARGGGSVGMHYSAAKAGMEGLTRAYAARLAKEGVTVNAVAPSLIETDMLDEIRHLATGRVPIGRFGTPQEVADAVLMVVANPYITGQCIAVNGGTLFT